MSRAKAGKRVVNPHSRDDLRVLRELPHEPIGQGLRRGNKKRGRGRRKGQA